MNAKNEIREAFVENKKIFAVLLVIFIISLIIGCVLADSVVSFLMPLIKDAMGIEGSASIDAFQIMEHNLTSVILVFFGSIIFGIYAIISISVNGFVIGFLALILPHGILEIPAFFCSCTAGLLLFLFIFKVIRDKIRKNTFKESYDNNKKTLKHAIILLLISIVLFAIAALIEGFITPQIGNIVSLQLTGTPLL